MTEIEPVVVARKIARRLIRLVRKNGCKSIEVFAGGERLDNRQTEVELIAAMCDTVGECAVVFRDATGTRLAWVLWIPDNGIDALSDYGVNPWADRVLGAFSAQLSEEEAARG